MLKVVIEGVVDSVLIVAIEGVVDSVLIVVIEGVVDSVVTIGICELLQTKSAGRGISDKGKKYKKINSIYICSTQTT